MKFKINQQVETVFGKGIVTKIEGPYGSFSNPWYQYGVLHEVFPLNMPKMFKDDILMFNAKEIRGLK